MHRNIRKTIRHSRFTKKLSAVEGITIEKENHNQRFATQAKSLLSTPASRDSKIIFIDGPSARTTHYLRNFGIPDHLLMPICADKKRFSLLKAQSNNAVLMYSAELTKLENTKPICIWLDYCGTYIGTKNSAPINEIPDIIKKYKDTCKFLAITLCLRDKREKGSYEERADRVIKSIESINIKENLNMKISYINRYGHLKRMLYIELNFTNTL